MVEGGIDFITILHLTFKDLLFHGQEPSIHRLLILKPEISILIPNIDGMNQ